MASASTQLCRPAEARAGRWASRRLFFPPNVRTRNPATAPGALPWKWANKSFSLLSHPSDLIFASCLGLLEGLLEATLASSRKTLWFSLCFSL